MKVVYTAPNRGHHYKYALALKAAGILYAFISGFPRLSPRAKEKDLVGKLHRADILQTIFIASLKFKVPTRISRKLAYLSKIEQDFACRKYVKNCDVFLFYSGSGLNSCRYAKKYGVVSIVEAVNSHVEYQEDILEQEFKSLGLPWTPFPKDEKERRLMEYEEADYILLPSEFVKRSFISKGFPESKLLKVPYGFNSLDNKNVVLSKDEKLSSFNVLYVGSISVRKGLKYLIEAFNLLDHPLKKLILVGPDVHDGALNNVKLSSDIVFLGVLKGDQLKEAYQSADVFCLPSIEEGLALVLGEALSFGLPIIATTNTGADDLIKEGEEGYIVPIKDTTAILNKLQSLVDSPELLIQMKQKSQLKSGELNGWTNAGDLLVKTLLNCVNLQSTK